MKKDTNRVVQAVRTPLWIQLSQKKKIALKYRSFIGHKYVSVKSKKKKKRKVLVIFVLGRKDELGREKRVTSLVYVL